MKSMDYRGCHISFSYGKRIIVAKYVSDICRGLNFDIDDCSSKIVKCVKRWIDEILRRKRNDP